MKIKNIFKDIFKGLAIESDDRYEKIEAYLIDTKDVENCRINYEKSGIQEVFMKVKDKYFLRNGDIIISTRSSESTPHVGYVSLENEEICLIPKKNFLVLRGTKENFLPEFVAEYLEIFGIFKYLEKNNLNSLTIQDIEEIEIPNVPLENQKELVDLTHPINERIFLYQKLIKNDTKIKKHIFNEVINYEE